MDYSFGELPDFMMGGGVAFTNSCVAVGTLSEIDGETTIIMTDSLSDIDVPDHLIFDGVLKTLEGNLSICDVANKNLLTIKNSMPDLHVQVFVNDISEPDLIVVFVPKN
ncbi:hypothetical protein JWH11_07430 [Xanthomonas melonis]|uniref:Uncharacterized protein n=2 Tax=Xanthomonas melonis TaxID=56456 RepID=A0ABS8NT69_9XANT|nr:hypothetical protein [Xanthomonas melonis]